MNILKFIKHNYWYVLAFIGIFLVVCLCARADSIYEQEIQNLNVIDQTPSFNWIFFSELNSTILGNVVILLTSALVIIKFFIFAKNIEV